MGIGHSPPLPMDDSPRSARPETPLPGESPRRTYFKHPLKNIALHYFPVTLFSMRACMLFWSSSSAAVAPRVAAFDSTRTYTVCSFSAFWMTIRAYFPAPPLLNPDEVLITQQVSSRPSHFSSLTV